MKKDWLDNINVDEVRDFFTENIVDEKNILFAIIGATIKAGVAYWLCFSVYSLWKLCTRISYLNC